MQTHEIRRRFLAHFENAGHTPVPSASLILDDPTLLFVNAGMVQFKPYFLGEAPPPWPTATSVQKCVRTGDIENVGYTTRHNTFFQMAGNFSFGDYFKDGAIRHAWALVTGSQDDGGYGFDPERVWVTVYDNDDEAERIWRDVIGLPAERIQRRDGRDNYWDMGIPGPGGPCSEIYYDRGPEHGLEGGPVVDEDRYVEIWNLVFMQDIRGEQSPKYGAAPIGELPQKNIDTGLGVERVAFLLQGVDNVYETDLVRPVIDRVVELSGHSYDGGSEEDGVRFRVIADHIRTGTMIIGDGVTPGNEGRGYVLRRLLRRVIRNARLLGIEGPVLADLVAVVRDAMGPSYPEIVTDYDRIVAVAVAEEDAFRATLATGSRLFDAAVADTRAGGRSVLSGENAFTLHDTYGFPIDLTLEMAAEAGLEVDEGAFRSLMDQQRARAKADAASRKQGAADHSVYRKLLETHPPGEFLGYTDLQAATTIVGLLVDGVSVPVAREGDVVEVVLDNTPFYGESGGQQADSGTIRTVDGTVRVDDVQLPVPGLRIHRGVVTAGEVAVDTGADAEVDVARRTAIARAHTGTHLIHAGVRNAVGTSAAQAGSLNAPGRLRFDFTSPSGAIPPSLLLEVEDEVNTILQEDRPVDWYVTSMDRARDLGAMMLFGEKYGDQVRVVDMGEYSRELCGGTHVARTGELGMVKVITEGSVGSGVRRVEALVGLDAFRYLNREHVLVGQLAEQLKTPSEELPERISGLVDRLRAAEKELESVRARNVLSSAGALADGADDVGGIALVASRTPDGVGGGDLRTLASDVRGRLGDRPGVVALFAPDGEKVSFVVATTAGARDRGLAAGDLVKGFAPAIGGRGGGKADLAQGGGSPSGGPAGMDAGIGAAIDALRHQVAGSAGA
ncbi:alanine--tRNA ligase [Actinomycetospora sp.]|uniref:alanine--tRNA ligase n=1 Tax=Actinomycetospora sp. TaxID=1872135 RepID=UPI002F41F648